jgi:phosphotransferase system HPr (HPr) family protein
MSTSCETTVVLPVALHARPAGRVVLAATRFQAQVDISYGGRTANARGVLGIMGLGAEAGDTVFLSATGEDAAEALDAVIGVLTGTE